MASEGYLQIKINELKDKFEELDNRFNTLNNNFNSKDKLLDSKLEIFNKKIEEFNNIDIGSIKSKLEEELKNEFFKIFENTQAKKILNFENKISKLGDMASSELKGIRLDIIEEIFERFESFSEFLFAILERHNIRLNEIEKETLAVSILSNAEIKERDTKLKNSEVSQKELNNVRYALGNERVDEALKALSEDKEKELVERTRFVDDLKKKMEFTK